MAIVSTDLDATFFFADVMESNEQLLFAGVFRSHIAFRYEDWLICQAQMTFTDAKTISFRKNGIEFATALFPSGGSIPVYPTVVMPSEVVNFNPNVDVFTIRGPATPDTTGGNIFFSFFGTRS